MNWNVVLAIGPSVDSLNAVFWQFLCVMVVAAAVIIFLVYRYVIEPKIARDLTKAKWGKGTPAFIENEVGVVNFVMTDKEFPEGLKHVKGKGWYCNAVRDVSEVEGGVKPKVGRPIKDEDTITVKDQQNNDVILTMITHTPLLAGFGKQVFFGSSTSVALTGLKAIAHADLRKTRLLAPRMFSKTQLANLADGSRMEGRKMAGGETTKVIILAIAAAVVIATVGLIVYLLLNGGGA